MSYSIQRYPTFDPSIDKIAYIERFKLHCRVNDLPSEKQVAVLLTSLNEETFDRLKQQLYPKQIVEASCLGTEDSLLRYQPVVNFRTERFTFHRLMQKVGQPMSAYIDELKTLAVLLLTKR